MILFICGFTPFKEVVLLPNTHVYSKTEVQKELTAEGKKHLPKLPKGHFKLIKVLPEGVGFALFQFDSVSGCGSVDSRQHSSLPTPIESLIDLPVESVNLFIGHMLLFGRTMRWEKNGEALKIDAILERQSPGQIAEPDRTSTMCEALKGYGKAWGLTVEVGTGHFSDKFCPFSGGE